MKAITMRQTRSKTENSTLKKRKNPIVVEDDDEIEVEDNGSDSSY